MAWSGKRIRCYARTLTGIVATSILLGLGVTGKLVAPSIDASVKFEADIEVVRQPAQ